MTVHVVILRDSCDSSECHAFCSEQDAVAVAKQQRNLGIWREIDVYEVEVDA